MGIAGFTKGKLHIPGTHLPPYKRLPTLVEYYQGRISAEEIQKIQKECAAKGASAHDEIMNRCGWPEVPLDGQLLMTHQDALLVGGKVQAPPGWADHVVFLYPQLCEKCESKICVEVCSGQAITRGDTTAPIFDREKCVHCGACFWNCAQPHPQNPSRTVLDFKSGAGGLHSAEN
jgi:electron-transferring-flavoprotein dehydrogenase